MKTYCLMCGALMSDKRHGARFCSLHCKNKYSYKERVGQLKGIAAEPKQEPETENTLDKSLRGVIEDNEKTDQKDVKEENKGFKLPFKQPNLKANIDADFFSELLNEKLFNVDNTLEQNIDGNNTPNNLGEQENQKTKQAEQSNKDIFKTKLPDKYISKEAKQENPFYNYQKALLANYEKQDQALALEYKKLEAELKDQQGRDGKQLILAGVLGGGIFSYLKQDPKENKKVGENKKIKLLDKNGKEIHIAEAKKKNKKYKLKKSDTPTLLEKWARTIFYAAIGAGIGKVAQVSTKDWREKDKQQKIEGIKKQMQAIKEQQQKNAALIISTKKIIEQTPVHKITYQKLFNPDYEKALSGLHQTSENTGQDQLLKKGFRQGESIKFKSDKIIKASDLAKMEHKAFNFDGLWRKFFGLPEINFKLLVHGNSGEGKSTFCMWFARYLAENFGRVLYVSGEEGLNKTFKDKLNYCKANVEHFYILDVRTGDELLNEVGVNDFHFIVLDSLHDMQIEAKKLKLIFAHYPNTAFICIDQNNKKGELLGANEKKHAVDMAVNIINYTAETTKNRFIPRGVIFKTADFMANKNDINENGNNQNYDPEDDIGDIG